MNIKKFEDAMNEIDEKYINEALEYKKKAKKPVYIKITAAAACFAAAVLIGFSVKNISVKLTRMRAGLKNYLIEREVFI